MKTKLWAARDICNIRVSIFFAKPIEENGNWVIKNVNRHGVMSVWRGITMPNDVLPELTFENSPQEVELKLINEIVGVAESPLKTFQRVNEFEAGASYRR